MTALILNCLPALYANVKAVTNTSEDRAELQICAQKRTYKIQQLEKVKEPATTGNTEIKVTNKVVIKQKQAIKLVMTIIIIIIAQRASGWKLHAHLCSTLKNYAQMCQ